MYKAGSVFAKRGVLAILLGIFTSLAVLTGVVTFYGSQVGNFVVGVTGDASTVGLILSENSTFENQAPQLNGPSMSDVLPITYSQIVPENVTEATDNAYISNEGNYMGYFFYLKNVGTEAVNVDVSMSVEKARKYVDRAVRVWIFVGEDDMNGTIYKLVDSTSHTYSDDYPATVNFIDSSTVMRDTLLQFSPGEVMRYNIIFWVEGQDPDCIDYDEFSILGGSIVFSMNFAVSEEL